MCVLVCVEDSFLVCVLQALIIKYTLSLQDTTFTMNSLQAMMGFKEPDMGNAPGASVKKGICVECRTECDCDVNQYCGASTELVIPVGVQSSNTGSGLTDYAREIMAAYGQAFSGMKLRGKCTSLPKVCVSDQKCISFCACRSSHSQYCICVRIHVNIDL